MRSRDLVFIAIVLVVVGGLYYLSTKGRARPVPSSPPEHLTAKKRDECLVCHVPQKMEALELAHRHPGKWKDARVSCFRCHAAADGANKAGLESQPEWHLAWSSVR